MNLIKYFSVIILLFSINLLAAKDSAKPYKLINANNLTINRYDNERVTKLSGNVHFFYGTTEFFSDNAIIFEERNLARLTDNVIVIEDTLKLMANSVEYDKKNRMLFLNEDVFIHETHIDSTYRDYLADKAVYDQNEEILTAFDNIDVFDSKENITSKSHYLKYNFIEKKGFIKKEPSITYLKKDTLTILANKIDYFQEYKKIVANYNVRILNDQLQTKSDFLIYYSNDEKAVMYGDPTFSSESADGNAIKFNLLFKNNEISEVQLRDSSFVKFSNSENEKEKNNWIDSKDIDLYFEEGKIFKCKASENVDSYIISENRDKNLFGNNVKSDTMFVYLDEKQKVKNIDVRSNVTGKYKFHNKSIDKKQDK